MATASSDRATRRVEHGRGHSYLLDGQETVGVTSVIGDGFPKPWLGGWAAREVAELAAEQLHMLQEMRHDEIVDYLKGAPWRDRDRAANRGTEVHRLAERLNRGEEVEVPDELTGHVDGYLRFLERYQPQQMLVELPVFSRRWRYAGTLDLLALLPDHGWSLIDLKTNRGGVFADTALQLAAYANADFYLAPDGQELQLPPIDFYGVLWLQNLGAQLTPMRVSEREFKAFLWCKAIGRWREDRADRPGHKSQDPVIGMAEASV